MALILRYIMYAVQPLPGNGSVDEVILAICYYDTIFTGQPFTPHAAMSDDLILSSAKAKLRFLLVGVDWQHTLRLNSGGRDEKRAQKIDLIRPPGLSLCSWGPVYLQLS